MTAAQLRDAAAVAKETLLCDRDGLKEIVRATLVNATIEEARAFHDAVFPHAEAAKAHLEGFDFNDFPESEARLMQLLLAFVEMAHVVELKWNETDIDDAFPLSRMTFGDTRPASSL